MEIGKDWQITADSLNVILSKKKSRKRKDTGEMYEEWKTMGYFATVGGALHELVNHKVRESELKDIKTISHAIDELHNMIETALKTSQSHNRGVKVIK